MFALDPSLGRDEPLRVLALGAHADDVEIGAGGTVFRLIAERPQTEVTLVVFSASGARIDEARASADALLADAARADVHVLGFRDGYFPVEAAEVKGWAQAHLEGLRPHLVLTHRRDDAHQDHRVVADLAWQTFRGAAIAAYEIPKWDGDLDRPNAYVALDAATRSIISSRPRIASDSPTMSESTASTSAERKRASSRRSRVRSTARRSACAATSISTGLVRKS